MTAETSRRRLARTAGRRHGGVSSSLSVASFLAVVSYLGRGAEAVSNGGKHSCSAFDDGTVKCTYKNCGGWCSSGVWWLHILWRMLL